MDYQRQNHMEDGQLLQGTNEIWWLGNRKHWEKCSKRKLGLELSYEKLGKKKETVRQSKREEEEARDTLGSVSLPYLTQFLKRYGSHPKRETPDLNYFFMFEMQSSLHCRNLQILKKSVVANFSSKTVMHKEANRKTRRRFSFPFPK